MMNKNYDVELSNISILFSEYANPSFEAQVECLKKAVPEMTIMTPEEVVQEKYGYTITEEEKAELIKKLYIINYGVENIDELIKKQNEKIKSIDDIKSEGVLNTIKSQTIENKYKER